MALGMAQRLSIHLGAQYLTVEDVAANQLVDAVRRGQAA
jgi:Mg-chelatase subunit ChlD